MGVISFKNQEAAPLILVLLEQMQSKGQAHLSCIRMQQIHHMKIELWAFAVMLLKFYSR